MAERLCNLRKQTNVGGGTEIPTLIYSSKIGNSQTKTVDCSSSDGKVIVSIGANYDSAVYSVDLNDNTVVKLAEYGDYQGRITVTCASKTISVTTGGIGGGMITVVK